MYLREKLDELHILKQKSDELSFSILRSSNEAEKDSLVKALLKCMDDIQNIKLILSKVNTQTSITIGKSKIDVTTAVIIRDNLNLKIKLISSIITSDSALNILTLMEQRDALLEEYNSINKTIRLTDWSVKLD